MADRKWFVRYWIKEKLVSALRCAKKGNKCCAYMDLQSLRGMLQYMSTVGDISDETYEKVYRLTSIIELKYDVF